MLQPESIKLESNLVDDLGFDSLEIIEFYLAIEEHFSINIPDEDRLKLLTVDDVVNYVTSHSRAN
jgi:acyl carrier protein